jgi:hypothetical protein
MTHYFCCLLNTFKDPSVTSEENVKIHPTLWGHSEKEPSWDGGWDGVGQRGDRPKLLRGRLKVSPTSPVDGLHLQCGAFLQLALGQIWLCFLCQAPVHEKMRSRASYVNSDHLQGKHQPQDYVFMAAHGVL